ncbi:unnamed protein product [Phytomonas sp. EM1]|nr:unnamed protein product [Phytomonas sp. EM1]|eukprot:CCW59603.1 unnamed protein product [Phytomonas sp. isolate EM1]
MLNTKQASAGDAIRVEEDEIGGVEEKRADSAETIPSAVSKPLEVVDKGPSNAEHDISESDACNDNDTNGGNSSATEVEEEEDSQYEDDAGGDDDDDDDSYTPEVVALSSNQKESRNSLVVSNKTYSSSAFVQNKGYILAQAKLRGNPKATFTLCNTRRPHNILKCRSLHLTNRAVLVEDRYVRLNMLLNSVGKTTLLENPSKALRMQFCHHAHEGTMAATEACDKLHLQPNIVFIGVPGLRTAYYEAELHPNLALTKLKQQPWETQCGTWCRNGRSHVITTCRFLHYQRGSTYTEKPNPPLRPLALIPEFTPKQPTKAAVAAKAPEYGTMTVLAGKKAAGRRQSKGIRGCGSARAVPLPEFARGDRSGAKSGAIAPAVVSHKVDRPSPTTKGDPLSNPNNVHTCLGGGEKIQMEWYKLLMLFLVLLVILFFLLVYAVKRPFA